MLATFSRSSAGRMRQRMSFRFRSTAWSASLPSVQISHRLILTTEHAPRRIHHRREVRHARAKLTLHILLPAHRSRLLQLSLCLLARCLRDNTNAALERRARRSLCVAPAEDPIRGCGVERAEVCEEVAEGPAGVGGRRGWVEERDGALFGRDVREELFVLLDWCELGLV